MGTYMQVVPMCKLHVFAASCSNLCQWMLVQLELVVFSFQPMVQMLQLHLSNLHCVGVVMRWCLYVVVVCDGRVWWWKLYII